VTVSNLNIKLAKQILYRLLLVRHVLDLKAVMKKLIKGASCRKGCKITAHQYL
jgi:hypothetical protein